MNHHLSEEQFADLLSGESSVQASQHLQGCEACRTELETTRAAVRSLDQLSFAWAQVEAPRRVRTPSRISLHLGGKPGWGLGLAALTAMAVMACTLHLPVTHGAASAARVEQQAPPPSNTDLAEDNRLLRSIDAALSSPNSAEIDSSNGVDTAAHAHRATKITVND